MIRKMLVIAAAVAMPVSVIAATAGTASAGGPTVNASNYTVTCTGITAKASFSPALTNAGSASSPEVTKIKGSASSCTVTPTVGGTPVTITGAKVSGTITNPTSTHTCGGLATASTETGALTVKWKSTPKLSASSSVASPTSVMGAVGGDGHATFGISFSGVTGDFAGTDAGASSTNDAETTTTVTSILTTCAKGLKSINITADTNAGAGPALHLG